MTDSNHDEMNAATIINYMEISFLFKKTMLSSM